MGLEINNRKDLVALYWNKAQQTLEEAEIAISAKRWSMAANRIYYALFHAVTALFVKNEIHVSTHRGTKTALGQHFVLTGKLSSSDGCLWEEIVKRSKEKHPTNTTEQ